MKKAIIPALAAFTLMFILMGLGGSKQDPVPAAPSVAIVRLQDLYERSKIGQDAMAHLEQTQQAAIARLTEVQAQMEKAREDKDEALEQRLQVELQGYAYSMQGMLNQEQERMVALVTEKIDEGLETFRKDNGLQMIISDEFVGSFDPAIDITEKALPVIDAVAYEIGSIPSLDAPVDEAAEAGGSMEPEFEEEAAPGATQDAQ